MRTLSLLLLLALAPLLSKCQLLNNYDTCRTQTYYQYIGSPIKETHIEKGRTVQDNGIISAGYVKQAVSQDALIIKQNAQGQVVWQKEYGNAANDERITDWRELTNKQLLVAGIATNRATQQSVFFMMLLAADGTVIWQRSYADPAPSYSITNAKIYPDYFGEFFFAVEGDSFIIYGMTSNTGTLNWQRNITTNPGTQLVAAISDYSRLLIATNSTESGYKTANFYYINYYSTGNPKNIRFTNKLGGANQNSHYVLQDVEQFSQYTYFSGIRSVGSAPYELIRVNINQGFIREGLETITTPGIVIDSSTRSAINLYGDAISFTAGRKSDWLHTIKMTGSNYTSYIVWASTYHLPDSIVVGGNIKAWDAGYVFFGYKELPGGNKRIVQLKTDSASLSATCISRQQANFGLIRNAFPADTVRYTQNNSHALASSAYNSSAASSAVDTLVLCKELQCPPVPLSNNCLNSFQKLYQSYSPGDYPVGLQIVNNRTFLLGVTEAMSYSPDGQTCFIAEMNSNGQVTNQKRFIVGGGTYNSGTFTPGLYKSNDSSLLLYALATTSDNSLLLFLAKIDTGLNVVWMKSLRTTATSSGGSGIAMADVKQGADGSYFLLYSNGVSLLGLNRMYLIKLSSSGAFMWSKVYKPSYPGYFDNTMARRLEVSGGFVYMMGVNAYNSYSASVLLKASENNGSLIWSKKFSNAYQYVDLSRSMRVYNGELYLAGIKKDNAAGSNRDNIMLKTGTDGSIINAASLKLTGTNIAPEMEFLQHNDGNIYMTSSNYYYNPAYSIAPQINATVNLNFDVITAKQRPGNNSTAKKYLAVGANQQLYETGANTISYYLWGNLYFRKIAPDGSTGTCPADTLPMEKITPLPITVSDINCSQADSVFTAVTPVFRTEQSFLATSRLLCSSVPGCNFIRIAGDSLICNRTLQYTFRSVRNTGCLAPVQWIYDSRYVQVTNETDSFITLRFLAAGPLMLKARLTSNCVPYTDSFLIRVIGTAPTLNLGADTTLCSGATLLLRAKKGFKTYLWQDGSTDSVFTVSAAGLYHVSVTDSCNNNYSDSIQVQMLNSGPVLNLGADRLFCNSTPITFNAHAGYLSYMWQNGSTDSVFTATLPGVYHVRVTDICNNTFRDTVKVADYRRATTLNLGADTLFCNAVAFQLKAGAGFKNYNWQNGTTDSVLLATNTGLYYVTVTDSCGAVFTDSIRISPDTIIPFDIGSDSSICKGDSIVLTATAGLSNYTWWPLANTLPQGPASIKVFPTSNTLYYVSAVKQNGCEVTDSVRINVFNTPTVNLGFDTRLCAGDTLQLNAGTGFSTYTWSTGEQTASIKAYRAGRYYVSATDNNYCTARDTLSIPDIIPLPVTQLPTETAICQGQLKKLHAGTGFASYLWNTSATTESISVTSIGQHWVTVTNSFGCRKTDTVHISKVIASPAGFMPFNDSTICRYESITVAPSQNFASYLWNTGSVSKSIVANSSGNYWLKVTDANGCAGIDSVTLLQKDCNIGLFFPNSFTPNDDGLNDLYKPKLYARLDTYHIVIYNRYGQTLFESRNITEGWNGKFKGDKLENGAYIWQCWYQLIGENMQNKSGTVLLIR